MGIPYKTKIGAMPLVYICDDEDEMIRKFENSHSGEFRIQSFTNIKKLQDAALETEPDLILLDLFWKKDTASDEAVEIADRKLSEFQAQIPELRKEIYNAYNPSGVGAVKDIRRHDQLKNTPILIFSKTGQLLLSREDVQDVVVANAGWLLKNQDNVTSGTEAMSIEQYILARRPYKTNQTLNRTIVVSLFALIVVLAYPAYLGSRETEYWLKLLALIPAIIASAAGILRIIEFFRK